MNVRVPVIGLKRPDSRLLWGLAALVALSVFLIDTFTPLDIAIAVLYAVVVMLVAVTGNRSATLIVAWCSVLLTLGAFLSSHDTNYTDPSIARCAVSLLAIGIVSVLALRNLASTARLVEQVQLLDMTHDAIVVYDMNDVISFWNHGAEELYGWTSAEAVGKRVHELTRTQMDVPLPHIREQLLSTGQWDGEVERTRQDGTRVVVSSRLRLWRDRLGRPRAVLATNNDITAQKRMEAELQRKQDELRAAIDAIPGMVWTSSHDGRLEFVNRRWQEVGVFAADLGGSSTDASPRSDIWSEIVHPNDLSGMERAWNDAIASGTSFEYSARVRRNSGEFRWMHIGAEPMRDAQDNVLRWYGVNTDIEERKRAEESLERSEALLSEAQRLSKTGSIAMRVDRGEMSWSEEAYRIYDYPLNCTPSVRLIEARTLPEDLPIMQKVSLLALAGEPNIDVEHRLCMPDGSIKHVHFVAHALACKAGSPDERQEYVGALIDVTEARRTHEALARSMSELAHVSRVTTLGELASSIAHEVTQPIAAIVTCGDAALRWLNRPQPDLGEAAQSISQMIRDAKRAGDVVRQTREMAKKRGPSQSVLDLNALVGESIELVRRELQNHRATLVTQLDPAALQVCADRVQIQQVLINLMMNGAQAMSSVNGGPRQLTITTRLLSDGNVMTTVKDQGTGIADTDSAHLFSPFFTTKADGMGMGLSICRSIIESHGGRISAHSPDEGGAELRFVLPVFKPAARAA
jgi:PAS domain S-box-containing protein